MGKKAPRPRSCSSSFEDSENEDPADYKKGGYHPVQIGDLLAGKYKILSKLGWGYFSTVWLASRLDSTKQFAIKIVKSESKYTEAALDEIKLCNSVVDACSTSENQADLGANNVVKLEDSFKLTGPNGEHICLIFEPLGETLLTVLQQQNYAGLPVAVVKSITKQILRGLHLLHTACQIIHTDLKPENILLAGDSQWRVKIVDLGNACWIHKHFTDDIQTRQYRSPEVILGCDYDEKVDIWSAACIVFELLTGDVLFQPKEARSFTKEEDHIAQIIELLGPIPERLRQRGDFTRELFTKKGQLRNIRHKDLDFWPLEDVLREKYRFERREADEIAAFLLPLLEIDPDRRASASQALSHKWLANVE